MFGVAQRLARIEKLMPRVCPACLGRPTIVVYSSEDELPRGAGCRCGGPTILWRSESPPELDVILGAAAEGNELLEEAAP